MSSTIDYRFGPGEDSRTAELIASAARESYPDPAALVRFHETLLFLRAHPAGPATLHEAEAALQSFSSRISAVSDAAPLEAPEISGIAGTAFSAVFTHDVAARLAALFPGAIDADWDGYDVARLAPCWRRMFPLLAEDETVEANVPYLDWPHGGLAGILRRLAPFPDREDLYASLELPLRWNLGNSAATRTLVRLDSGPVFFHDAPLLRRSDVSLEAEMAGLPLPVSPLTPAEGRAVLDAALATSATRYRELYGFTYGDSTCVRRAEAGRGVVFYFWGLPPGRRLPLRAYHCALIVKNGVPVGYFETLTLGARMEVGFNIYYTFRDGESAWLYARLLRLFRQLMPVSCFSIDPYQIGHHNDEAIDSGAFWFYRKLGFRPADPAVARLLAAEEKRLAVRPGYRTPPARLRKLAAGYVVFGPHSDWDQFRVRNLGLAVSRLCGDDLAAFREESLERLGNALGLDRDAAFADWAQILALVPDLADWSAEEKRALEVVLRAKAAGDEAEYVRLVIEHARLCDFLPRTGSSSVKSKRTPHPVV